MKLPDSFESINRLRFLNRWLQILLLIGFIGGVNFLTLKHWHRWDLTQNHHYALVPETRAYLAELPNPVTIFVTIPPNSPRRDEQALYRYVSRLLREISYYSRVGGESRISVEFLDIYKDLGRAAALFQEFKLDQPNAVLVTSGGRQRLIRADELLVFENQRPVQFKGEASLLSAIIQVTQDRSPVLYFLQGHEETLPDDSSPYTGLSDLTRELRLRNFSIQPLDLARLSAIPDDAAAVVIADPKGPLRRSEVELLRDYLLNQFGRLIIWTRPGVDLQMDALFHEWGMHLPNRIIVEANPDYRDANGTLLIRNLAEHTITQPLIDNQSLVLSGPARPVMPADNRIVDERLAAVPLLGTSTDSWAGIHPLKGTIAGFNAETDLKGPLPIAFAAERKASTNLGLRVLGGRIALFGSADLFGNQHLKSIGNLTLFFNTLNWLIDQNRLLSIPPKPIEAYHITISESELAKTALFFLLVPTGVAIFGLLVHWSRR